MGSITGLKAGNFTSINNSGQIRLGAELDSGASGQALISRGPGEAAVWDTHTGVINPLTMGTDLSLASGNATFDGSIADTINAAGHGFGTGGNGIDITGTTITTDNDNTTITNSLSGKNQVLKVPNPLTAGTDIVFSSGTTYDGSAAITINSTPYTGTVPIAVSGGNAISLDYDGDTLDLDGADLAVQKVPNTLTASTNIIFTNTDDGSLETSYDGSQPITIRATDTNTEYTAGTNLNLSITTFNLDTSITGQTGITFLNSGASTNLTGSNYPNTPTIATNLDLTSSTNITSPYFLHDVYDPSSADADSLTTSYAAVFSSNLKNSFTAQSTSCCIELLIYNYSISGNRWLYLQLGDNKSVEWSSGATADGGGTGTGTRQTARLIHYSDETDKQPIRQTWFLQGLTIGTSYTINPMAKTSSTLNYIYAGGSYPASILRGYYLPS
jgi:hypothetical protein